MGGRGVTWQLGREALMTTSDKSKFENKTDGMKKRKCVEICTDLRQILNRTVRVIRNVDDSRLATF